MNMDDMKKELSSLRVDGIKQAKLLDYCMSQNMSISEYAIFFEKLLNKPEEFDIKELKNIFRICKLKMEKDAGDIFIHNKIKKIKNDISDLISKLSNINADLAKVEEEL